MPERRRSTKTRRRYDLSLSTPGAEMRLPAIPEVRLGWRLFSGFAVAGLLFLLFWMWNSTMFRVGLVEVEGLRRLTLQDINAAAGLAGKPVFILQPEKIRQDLSLAFPEISAIQVEIKLPAKVGVKVEERQPVLTWQSDNQVLWVDAEGVGFPPRGEAAHSLIVIAQEAPITPSAGEPSADGTQQLEPAQLIPPELVTAIQVMGAQAPENTPLLYDREFGLGWQDQRGWDVFFGPNGEDMEVKLKVYKAIVKRLKKESLKTALISVEFVHAPYLRLEH
ncbi:MAG TPA: FtsQ-type POTRA domain-containing protein [Anaerolineales bacterium]|nr:FtsQ-type POTRA domain-containing protein [Anaerolineales bacterium]